MDKNIKYTFICFAAEDRYDIAEPIVYHLKNYGIDVWYDRQALLLGDNRVEKNLIEGASNCKYAILVLSKNTRNSPCAMEEISIIKNRFLKHGLVVFPILYELCPNNIPSELQWVKDLIYKEIDHNSGTREVCNHIACKITEDLLSVVKNKKINSIVSDALLTIPKNIYNLLYTYQQIDTENLNARVAILYATYLSIISTQTPQCNSYMISKIFERLWSETRLNLIIDYRELWLLENSICLLIHDFYSTWSVKL